MGIYREENTRWLEEFGDSPLLSRRINAEKWYVLDQAIKMFNTKKILEFGSGLSTLLFARLGCKTVSLDTDSEYIKIMKRLTNDATFIYWDNTTIDLYGFYDMAFVDGKDPRLNQVFYAQKFSNIVIVDDFGGYSSRGTDKFFDDNWQRVDDKSKQIAVFIRKIR